MLLPADPKANYLAHKSEIDDAIRRVLDSGQYILGAEVASFEKEFADYLGARVALGVSSGTDAIHLALRACVEPGDYVITVSHTAVATVAAIELAGAKPILVDIDPADFNMDPNKLEDTIRDIGAQGKNFKAVIPVHLYGLPANMPAIMEIAARYGLLVIEDCAQSHGTSIQERKTGTWGKTSAFSFYPTKNLGALGDGGAVVTSDREVGEKLQLLREYGWREKYISDIPGMNCRLDELQAAILRVKLRYLEGENARRREIARIYDTALSASSLILPKKSHGNTVNVYHQYVVRTAGRDDLKSFLKQNSVITLIHYPVPVHLQPAYRGRTIIGKGGLQHTETICREILSLPIHPQMTDAQARHVAELILRWDEQQKRKH